MKQKKTGGEKIKSRGLFDHINHIREVKDPNYYNNLSEEEKKSFNTYMLLRILSMDKDIIDEISFISKYSTLIPNEQFYQLLITVVPKGRKFCKYIKNSGNAINEIILNCICNKFSVGKREASDYFTVLLSTESGIKELTSLVQSFGYSEKEIEKLFE